MGKKTRLTLHANILIVCEGEVTEPEYLALLKKMALEKDIWQYVEIKPKPRSEAEVSHTPVPHKSARPRRQLIPVDIPDEADATERAYNWRQTPVRFVKEARDGLKEGTYQEAWAVFDKDGHPSHQQAFELAAHEVEGIPVRIAFTSIAFEHWMLLHFEKNNTEFAKSACKQENKYLDCGTGDHPDDCWGTRCVSGYMRAQGFLTCSTKYDSNDFKTLLSTLLEEKTRHIAYHHAAWLRANVDYNPQQPYHTNPWTNMDELVKRLLDEEHIKVQWGTPGRPVVWELLTITINTSEGEISLHVSNHSNTTTLFNGAALAMRFQAPGTLLDFIPQEANQRIIAPNSDGNFTFPIPAGINNFQLEFTKDGSQLLFEV